MAINFGDVLDRIGKRRRDELALTSDTGSLSWAEFTSRTNALAHGLLAQGLTAGDKVGFYLFNGADYVETLAACLKARLVHVNINFRYLPNELDYVLNDVEVSALVFDHRLADRVEQLPEQTRARILRFTNSDASGNGDCVSLSELRENHETSLLDTERRGDDFIFICTGGTTGQPKAVMWEQADLARALFREALGSESRDHTDVDLIARLDEPKAYTSPLVASPLMHGAGLLAVLTTFANGGHVIVTDNNGPFDARHHWMLVERHKADALAIVGDAFAKPLLQALEQGHFNLESLRLIGSSGVMWSRPVKQKFLEYIPQVKLFDSLGSSEAMGLGASMMDADGSTQTARFTLGVSCAVFDEDNQPVLPGSGKPGFLARSGPMPRGYYNDPDKTARTFREIDGVRYCFPGDMCTVEADLTINLLGRGSSCINTGGEKVFPEEVEEALKLHPDVSDALVFGLDDPNWGQSVTAVVLWTGDVQFDVEVLRTFLRDHLAPYKIPKRIHATDQAMRKANGKADYAGMKALFPRAA